MSKKIIVAMFLLVMLVLSTVAVSAAYSTMPNKSNTRTTSIFNDPMYAEEVLISKPISTFYAQRVLSHDIPSVKQRTLVGAKLYTKYPYTEPALGREPGYQRILAEDPRAIFLQQRTGITRYDVTEGSYVYSSNVLQRDKLRWSMRRSEHSKGRLTSRASIYRSDEIKAPTAQRMLKKNLYSENVEVVSASQRRLSFSHMEDGIVINAQRSLMYEMGLLGKDRKLTMGPSMQLYPTSSRQDYLRLRFLNVVPPTSFDAFYASN